MSLQAMRNKIRSATQGLSHPPAWLTPRELSQSHASVDTPSDQVAHSSTYCLTSKRFDYESDLVSQPIVRALPHDSVELIIKEQVLVNA